MTVRRVALAVILTSALPAIAAAQDRPRFVAGGSVGIARTWDDESMLGTGLMTEGRFGVNLTAKTQVEFVVTHFPYERSFESGVATEGRSIYTGLLLKHDFTRGTVRPFVVAGYGLNAHRGSRTHPPLGTSDTESTDHGYLFGGGFVVARGNWEVGPEARGYMLAVESDASASMILSGGIRASVRF
jgi:hypothetical protein